jgi:prophage regulatory protein
LGAVFITHGVNVHMTNPHRSLNPPVEDAPPTTPAEPGRLLRLPAVLGMVGLGRSCWFGLVKAGRAPRPIKIGRAALWIEDEVSRWVRDRVVEARTGSR